MQRGNVPDLLVIGGGIVGLSCAWEAARQGLHVRVLERGRPGREASWAAAGMLSPFAEAESEGPFLEFGLTSLALWRDWARTLEAESGIEIDYQEGGKLLVAFDPSEAARLQQRVTWAHKHGLRAHWLDAESLLQEEPDLAPTVKGGLSIEADFRVDPRKATAALERAALGAGVDLRSGTEVRGLWRDADRIRGVLLQEGSRMEGGRVLVAGGAWSGRLEGLPRPVPVRPIRGQMLALVPDRLPSERVLASTGVYLVPRSDGRLLVGATMEEVGYQAGPTVGGIRQLLDAAVHLVPGLTQASIAEFWSGLRPGTPDGFPILGADPGVEGLLLATGHFRNGILLAPLTAAIIGTLVRGEIDPRIPSSFLPDRALR